MVIPLTPEREWMPRLTGLPLWEPGSAPMLVISPHPDDETLALGGLIASQRRRGSAVRLVAVTDGENAYPDNERLGEVRVAEQTSAAARLGIDEHDIVRLRLTDSGVAAQEERLFTELLALVSAETHILAPWRHDFHPDHEACAAAAERVAKEAGALLTSYFFWTWHRGTPSLLDGLSLAAFELSEEDMQAKREALAYHASQLQHASGDPILPENLLWPARLPFEVFLPDAD